MLAQYMQENPPPPPHTPASLPIRRTTCCWNAVGPSGGTGRLPWRLELCDSSPFPPSAAWLAEATENRLLPGAEVRFERLRSDVKRCNVEPGDEATSRGAMRIAMPVK